jgi:hypothetical protein
MHRQVAHGAEEEPHQQDPADGVVGSPGREQCSEERDDQQDERRRDARPQVADRGRNSFAERVGPQSDRRRVQGDGRTG